MDERMTCLITGADEGLGLETAKQMAAAGLTVIGTGHDPERCRRAGAEIRRAAPRGGGRFVVADLASVAGVRRAAAAVREALPGGRLDRLVHAAAVVTKSYVGTEDGYELQFAVNYLAAFLLTGELFPALIRPAEARVITVSSGVHRGTAMNWADPMSRRRPSVRCAYRRSKLALVLFTLELNRRVAFRFPVRGIGIEPGPFGPGERAGGPRGLSASDAASAVVRLALSPPASLTGAYWRLGRPVLPSSYARDADAAGRLWRLSESPCDTRFL